ncbi:MAG: HIT family protein [Candidatus Dormibacteria bacterium]
MAKEVAVMGAGASPCYSCGELAPGAELDQDQAIWREGGWRLAHAFNSSLPGWLVLLPDRHLESLAQLSSTEARVLGQLLWRASRALQEVTGCAKTYVALFAEAEGFHHLHFHLVPRASDLAEDRRGPAIFESLHRPEAEWVEVEERRRLALRLRRALAASSIPEEG